MPPPPQIFLLFFFLFLAPLKAQEKPNILVFLVDDMGIMDTSLPFLLNEEGKPKSYPLNQWYNTPSLEKLAQQGIRFNQFYAMSVCSPSRISLLTGQNSVRHGTTNWISPWRNNTGDFGPSAWNWQGLNKQSLTLPRLLAQSGYRTIHVGKAHFGPLDSEGSDPLNLGFQINIAGTSTGQPGSYLGSQNFQRETGKRSLSVPHLEAYHQTETHLSQALTQEAQKQIKSAQQVQVPFFLHLAHYAAHTPFELDARFAQNYQRSSKSRDAQAFATLIEGVDASLGQILAFLEQEGMAEKTLIFFLGDNGSDAPLGEPQQVGSSSPLRGKKGTHYEGGTRVPLVIAWAKLNAQEPLQQAFPIAEGGIQTQLSSIEDIFPTVLEIAHIPLPENHPLDGVSLKNRVTGVFDPRRKERFLLHYPHGRHRSNYFSSLRDKNWKVIYHYLPQTIGIGSSTSAANGAHYELFNLKQDPFEQQNLALSHPDQLSQMMKKLIQALQKQNALYPVDAEGNTLSPQMP